MKGTEMDINHKWVVENGVSQINAGLCMLKSSAERSNNILLQAIIHNIEDQLSMIDGKNEVYPR